jgi:predicted TIM-barrel fold metal-dependent hydrolase
MLRCEPADQTHASIGCGCHPAVLLSRPGRRSFLGLAAAGATVVALGHAGKATAQNTARDIAQDIAKPFRIDVHHHYTSPALLAMMKGRRTNQTFNEQWTLEKSLDAMEQGGVATAVVSTSDPGVFFGDYNAAQALARNCNEYQARMVADHPGRFGMFTTLPMPDIDMTLAEIAYGMDTLKAHGVGMMTSYAGKYLGDPAFTPVMQELNRRKAVVFVHPLMTSCCTGLVPGVPEVVVEYQSETSRTIASLLFSGTTGRFPDIRFIFSHGGGTVPYLVARFDRLFNSRPDLVKLMPEGCVGALRRLYFDTAQAYNPYAMAALTRLMPDDHILFGSDFPAASPQLTAEGLAAFGLSPAALRAINRDNALGLMPTLA